MPSDFLSCTICTKQPRFSDVSHLLTHVGSKGHLAHLHRLQVKSQQELDAAHQLAVYNQWFQEHGVANLLSERMQQKESRKAIKKAAERQRSATVRAANNAQGRKGLTNTALIEFQQPHVISAYEALPPALKSRRSTEEDNDLDYTSIRAPRDSNYPTLGSSPSRMLPSQPIAEDEIEPTMASPGAKASPGTPQLKGTVWPGMDLFDAAPEELKRKRNQKKDGSVLKKLERNAALVEPTETVYSTSGFVLKHRHMDDLENDSPVEGETVLQKPSPKKRKSSARRARKDKKSRIKKEEKNPVPRQPGRPRRPLETPSKLPSSSIPDMIASSSHFSPTEDENREFKFALRGLGRKRKNQKFTIYQDSSPSFGGDGSAELMPASYTEAMGRTQLAYPPLMWHRQQSEPYDPFKLIRERFSHCTAFSDICQDKENVAARATITGMQSRATVNPLLVSNGTGTIGESGPLLGHSRSNPIMAPESDPFRDNHALLPVRNPLMAALERVKQSTSQAEGFDFVGNEPTAHLSHYRQPLFAP